MKEKLLGQKILKVSDNTSLTIVGVGNEKTIDDATIELDNGRSIKLFVAIKNGAFQFADPKIQKEVIAEIENFQKSESNKKAQQAQIEKEALAVAKENAKKEEVVIAKTKSPRGNRTARQNVRRDRRNIAYKATYCDGNGNWFAAPCSAETRNFNCNETTRARFCRTNSICKEVENGDKSEAEIMNAYGTNFLCYECKLLREFTIYAGRKGNGALIGWKLESDRIAILTTIFPYQDEEDRVIFGAILINRSYDKDEDREAYATSFPEYRIALTPEEAKTMKYWEYAPGEGANKNLIQWNEQLWRYQNDSTCATILKDLVAVIAKRGNEAETQAAQAFLDKFLGLIKMNEDDIPAKAGALIK